MRASLAVVLLLAGCKVSPLHVDPIPNDETFCRRGDDGLIVRVANVTNDYTPTGNWQAVVQFSTSPPTPAASQSISPLPGPGATTDLLFAIPSGCFGPDCGFTIRIIPDPGAGKDITGNEAQGICIG